MKLANWSFFLVAAIGFAQPHLSSVKNAASNIPAGFGNPGVIPPIFPNAGIAQGAMFVALGDRIGPASIVVANSFPLKTSLAGTSIQVTVNGTTVNAIMYYTQAQYAAAILPSNTPIGIGNVTLTYNGQSSSTPIVVVQNNVGMYTIGETGSGDAVATLSDYSVVLPNNAPNPGEVITFWANGLGPVPYDETMPALGGDMSSVPLQVFIGGKSAPVLYHGRNPCCVSEDQINVQIPPGATGCVVSVTMQIGNLVSNTTTIPVAATGRLCTPTNPAISQNDIPRLLAKPTLSIGSIVLGHDAVGVTPSGRTDGAAAMFRKYSGPSSAMFDSIVDIPSFGSCTLYVAASPQDNTDPTLAFTAQSLDAGSGMNITGPNGSKPLNQGYTILDANGSYLNPGQYTVAGTRGQDIGSFQATLSIPFAPFVWTNQAQISAINRASGVTVTWTGGDTSGYVAISGQTDPGARLEPPTGASPYRHLYC